MPPAEPRPASSGATAETTPVAPVEVAPESIKPIEATRAADRVAERNPDVPRPRDYETLTAEQREKYWRDTRQLVQTQHTAEPDILEQLYRPPLMEYKQPKSMFSVGTHLRNYVMRPVVNAGRMVGNFVESVTHIKETAGERRWGKLAVGTTKAVLGGLAVGATIASGGTLGMLTGALYGFGLKTGAKGLIEMAQGLSKKHFDVHDRLRAGRNEIEALEETVQKQREEYNGLLLDREYEDMQRSFDPNIAENKALTERIKEYDKILHENIRRLNLASSKMLETRQKQLEVQNGHQATAELASSIAALGATVMFGMPPSGIENGGYQLQATVTNPSVLPAGMTTAKGTHLTVNMADGHLVRLNGLWDMLHGRFMDFLYKDGEFNTWRSIADATGTHLQGGKSYLDTMRHTMGGGAHAWKAFGKALLPMLAEVGVHHAVSSGVRSISRRRGAAALESQKQPLADMKEVIGSWQGVKTETQPTISAPITPDATVSLTRDQVRELNRIWGGNEKGIHKAMGRQIVFERGATPPSLDPSNKYVVEDIEINRNWIKLRNVDNNATSEVAINTLIPHVKEFIPAPARQPGNPGNPENPKKAETIEALKELINKREPSPTVGSNWYLPRGVNLTGEYGAGANKGLAANMPDGTNYSVTALDRDGATITLMPIVDTGSIAEPITLNITEFVRSMNSEQTQLKRIFEEQYRNNKEVPDKDRIELNQHYIYRRSASEPMRDWIVTRIAPDKVELMVLNLATNRPMAPKHRVDRVTLALEGEYIDTL